MNVVKRVLRWFLAGVLLVVLLMGTAVIYIEFNQQKILASIQRTLAANINGSLHIEHISLSFLGDFPHLSLTAKGISIRDSLYRKEVFSAKRIYFRLNVADLLRFKIGGNDMLIQDGNFFLKRDSTGYFNANIFRTSDKPSSGGSDINFELQRFETRELKVVFDDYGRQQQISVLVRNMQGRVTKGDNR